MSDENVNNNDEQAVADKPKVTTISDDVQPGSPDRLPKVPAMNQEGVFDKVQTPQPYEVDVLGTTDGEEDRRIEEDLVTKISRPILPSALPASSTEAKVAPQSKEDHIHITETVAEQTPLPGVGPSGVASVPQPNPPVQVEQEIVEHDNTTEGTVLQPADGN